MGSEDKSTIEVAALGRPFSLGMLYDCHTDVLIPGMTLWGHDDLVNHIGERRQHYSSFQIVASESIEDKSSALDVSATLKASFLSGNVEVGGAARYLRDDKKSKNKATVTLMYEATTKFQQLSMDHLGKKNMKYLSDFKQGQATHVVTGILYGAKAFFVFDRDVSQDENRQDVEGKLRVMIKKIPSIEIDGQGSLKMKDTDFKKVEKFSCRFHGDFLLKKTPSSFQDAVEVYQSLTDLLGPNGENAVPVKVWLLPLILLDTNASTVKHVESPLFIEEVQAVLEDLKEVEVRCNDALTTTGQQFSEISKKIKTFKNMCSGYKMEFQRNLAKKLPAIRAGEEEEVNVLAEIMKKKLSDPFNNEDLNEWMDRKEREIYTLKSFTGMMKNTKILTSQSDLYKETLSAEHAVCFVFNLLGGDEPVLTGLSNHLKQLYNQPTVQGQCQDKLLTVASTNGAETQSLTEKEQWYASKEVADPMRHKAKLFSDFAEANKEKKNIKFLAVASTNAAEKQEGSSIFLYKDGFAVGENFVPPSKPKTVAVSNINHDSVTLKICPPEFGAENITYSVEYCVSGQDGWREKTAPKDEVTVSDLIPDTEYKFRCRAVTSAGVGPAAEVNGPIKTLPWSPRGKPQDKIPASSERSAAQEGETSGQTEGEDSQDDLSPSTETETVTSGAVMPQHAGQARDISGSDKTSPCRLSQEAQDEPNSSEAPGSSEKPAQLRQEVKTLGHADEVDEEETRD